MRRYNVMVLFFVMCAVVLQPVIVSAMTLTRTGVFVWRHGDDQQGRPVDRYFLQNGDEALLMDVSDALLTQVGGARAIDGRLVQIEIAAQSARSDATGIQVIALVSLERTAPQRAVTGAQPWLTIMCKFSDVATESKDYTYFANMYASTFPGLNHYWQEVSFNKININGSGTAGSGWYTLPQPRAYYVDADGDGNLSMEFSRAANDCTAVADADVDFSPYVGINLMFNSDLDGYAWGGGMNMTLDGVSKYWNMTWEPPWGYSQITVMSHEMGHGLGLPHSSGQYTETYDNAWDVMSDAWFNCSYHEIYGCLGQHTIAYHKNMLGWIAPGDQVQVSGARVMRIDHLAMADPNYYHMATIPIPSTANFYTVEVRQQTGYDVKLPAKAVIIHHINPSRDNEAQVIDIDNNGNTADAGAQWLVGEQFVAGNITVKVVSAYTNGFKVLIRTVDRPVIWGNAGVAGAKITYTGGSTTADAYGDYAFAVPSGWSGTITPSKSGYQFVPASQTYTNVTADVNNKNYVAGTKATKSIQSVGARDGLIQETVALNNRGETTKNTGLLTIGDTAMRQQRRAILAFDTSAIPDDAVITKVTLRLTYAGVTGKNPFDTHGNLLVDVRNGWFGTTNTLQPSDFEATASLAGTGPMRSETTTRYGASWTSGVTTRINKRGETQFRLRFSTKHDGDGVADTINFYDGAATSTQRPVVIVEYLVP
jgi:M6 family metalloprotease-like protein